MMMADDERGEAELTARVEEDAAEADQYRADEAAELAAELADAGTDGADSLAAHVDDQPSPEHGGFVSVAWSPDIGAYAAGLLDVSEVRCALCGHAPCQCPPFGTPEYLALVDQRHGRKRDGR